MRLVKVCVPFALSFAAFAAVNLQAQQVQQVAAATPPNQPFAASESAPPDQAPVFQRALLNLDAQRQAVAEQAPKLSGAAQRQFLERTLSQALEETSQVESEYREVLQVHELPDADSALFDAIRARYRDTEHEISGSGKLLRVNLPLRRNATPVAETLSALSYNEHLYRNLTGETAGLFDLKVVSYPAGAKITYWESSSGEVQYAAQAGTTITALPVSVWFVRAELPGHEPIVQTYDAYVQTDGKLVFNFNK